MTHCKRASLHYYSETALEGVLDDFKARGWIDGYSIGRGDERLVAIDKVRTPSQVRAVTRRAAPDADPG